MQLDEDTLARRHRDLGEDHPDTLTAASNLAVSLRAAGEYQAARELDEDTLAPPPRSLGSGRARDGLEAGLRALPASAGQRIALSQLARITALSAEITGLEKDLAALVTVLVPELLAIPGVAVITAAKIIGETGDIRRFRSPAAFARHNGTAPVPASSGTGTGGPQRLNRGGNRQLNAALHRVAVVQARCHPGAAALLERRGQDKHETGKASLRVLKRHLSDVIYRALNADAWRLGSARPPSRPTWYGCCAPTSGGTAPHRTGESSRPPGAASSRTPATTRSGSRPARRP